MDKRTAIAIALLVGAVGVGGSIGVSLGLARRQAAADVDHRLTGLSRDLLARAMEIRRQAFAATAALERARTGDPCGEAMLARMRRIDVASRHLQAVGYVADGRLMCSSLGSHGAGIPLGHGRAGLHGITVWTEADLHLGHHHRFLVISRGGWAAIIHREVITDLPIPDPRIALALVSKEDGVVFSTVGEFRPEWIRTYLETRRTRFDDGRSLVAVVASDTTVLTAMAVLPLQVLRAEVRSRSMVLVPIGSAFALVLILVLVLLTRQQLSLPAEIQNGLRRDEFYLEYQPVVSLRNGECVGAEALLRWRRSDGSIVRPDVFIPVAEESGLMQRVTRRVLEIVERDTAEFLRCHPHFCIGINLSSSDLETDDTVSRLRWLVEAAGVTPRNFILEATERGLLNEEAPRRVIAAVRAIGSHVAIDDFGTGYSSLSYLATYELDYLKIDKTFVDTLGTEAATSQVVLHIIEMAKALNLVMIAEGVETEAQAEMLRALGVQYAQGWLFAPAMPIAELAAFMDRRAGAARIA